MMTKDKEKEQHFKNALSNYLPVLNDDLLAQLEKADEGLSFPESPEDVLEYLGNIEPLDLSEEDKNTVREWVRRDVREKGAKEVWELRFKAKMEIYYIVHGMGLK